MTNLFKAHSGEVFHRNSVLAYKDIFPTGSCWGTLTLEGKKEVTAGDGSYYRDGRHVSHICFNFKRFCEWMEGAEQEKWQKGDVYDGSKLFED